MRLTDTFTGFGRKLAAVTAAAVVALGAAGAAQAQSDYPNKPVTIILPFGTGGVSDIIARTLAPHLEEALGQRFVIENMPGAAGMVATKAAFEGDNQGYTLMNAGHSATIRATTMPNPPLSQIDDFDAVAPVGEFGLVVVAQPDGAIGSIEDLVAAARENPGAINIGTVAVGSTQHLAALLFKSVAGIDAAVIPYNSSPEAMAAVTRGEVDVAFEIIAGAQSAIESEQVVPIAITLDRRSEAFPDLPTVEEGGVSPYYVSSWNSYMSPKGIPDEVVDILNTEIQRILQLPEVKKVLLSYGVEPFVGDAQTVRDRIASDVARWHDVIVEAGIPIQK